jgi:hypothetical protein
MDSDFRLIIECEQLPAVQLSRILGDLDGAFRAFGREQEGRSFRAELTVVSVRFGSIEILIDAIGAVEKLTLASQYLTPFATHLAELATHVIGWRDLTSLGEISSADKKVLKSLANPVANGQAQQINIVNNGTLNVIVENPSEAKRLLQGIASTEPQTKLRPAEEADHIAVTRRQLSELKHGDLMGTAFQVDGTWYARLAGQNGVLVPISLIGSGSQSLIDGKAYEFRGTVLRGPRGEINGLAIDNAQPL